MAKGKVYRLVDAEGHRLLVLPLSLWPSLTGIISDNEFQFSEDCWDAMVSEVISMPFGCYPPNLLYCFKEEYFEVKFKADADAGTNILSFSKVPAGEVWIVTAATLKNSDHAMPASAYLVTDDGDKTGTLASHYQPEVGRVATFNVNWLLVKDDRLLGVFYGCTVGDYLTAVVSGCKLEVV